MSVKPLGPILPGLCTVTKERKTSPDQLHSCVHLAKYYVDATYLHKGTFRVFHSRRQPIKSKLPPHFQSLLQATKGCCFRKQLKGSLKTHLSKAEQDLKLCPHDILLGLWIAALDKPHVT